MTPSELEAFFAQPADSVLWHPDIGSVHEEFLRQLESGIVRAAEPMPDGTWRVNAWVKHAILLGFKRTGLRTFAGLDFGWVDKTAYPPRQLDVGDGIRLVPGGSAIRRGAHVARGVVVMPPAYINVGAFVGEGSMVDSHALVGSCAQIGARVHLSAAAQIGGVLEPIGARPVIVEDDAFVGALAGLFEGVLVRRRAVIAAGVVITAATKIHDLVKERILESEVPEGAVVVPGVRQHPSPFAKAHGLALATPVIVKYRDEKTDARTALEDALR